MEDHRIERDQFARLPEYVQMWAFSLLESEHAQTVEARVLVTGAVTLWLNGQALLREEGADLAEQREAAYKVSLPLQAGENSLMLLVEEVTVGPVALSAAVHVAGSHLSSAIPILSHEVEYWQKVENAFAESRLDRAVYTLGDTLTLLGPQAHDEGVMRTNVRVQDNSGRIYGEFTRPLLTGEPQALLPVNQLPAGNGQVVLMPLLQYYYESQFRPARAIPFLVSNEPYSPRAEALYEDRLVRLIQEAARREGIFGEVARMMVGFWQMVDMADIQRTLQSVRERQQGCWLNLLGLLLMHARLKEPRLWEQAGLPDELMTDVQSVVTGFAYELEEPADDVTRFLSYAAQALSGQAFASENFASGRSGAEEQALGESQALEWIQQHAQWGFTDWNPDPDVLTAVLVLLVDLSNNDALSDLAAVFLDKLLFLQAMHSFKGLPETVRQQARASYVKSERFQPGAALGLLLWGEGVYNQSLTGAICLALSQNYALPEAIRAIGQEHDRLVWARQRSQRPDGTQVVLQALYKTPEYRLSSAQPPQPGQPGAWEHVWQATLGPEALVFTNAPGHISQSDMRPAGFWRGNRCLPQVAQWKDALLCLYRLPEEDLLDFTHAYFPIEAFDAYRLEGQWAFAQKGEVYLGLYASQELTLVERGDDAYRELRVPGAQTAWLCQMGRASEDGSFDDFCTRLLANPPQVEGLQVQWQTLRGDTLALDWNEPLRLNGGTVSLGNQQHLESPYVITGLPAVVMDINFGEDILRLDFA